MVIDIHTHTFPEKIAAKTVSALAAAAHLDPFTDATNPGLLSSMEQAGVDLSVVLPVATSPRQVEKVNDASAALNRQYGLPAAKEEGRKGALLSFGCMHPDHEDALQELVRMKELGLVGVKLHPAYQGVDLDDIRYLRIMEKAAELGMVVISHMGLDIGIPGAVHCTPRMCRHAQQEIGPFPFIAAHMGGWRNWEEVPEALADTEVYLDTAFSLGRYASNGDGYWSESDTQMLSAEQFMKIKEVFGAGRLLFGSDSPWGGQAESIRLLKELPLSEQELGQILGGNAAELLRKR